jgi:hypothetical protein
MGFEKRGFDMIGQQGGWYERLPGFSSFRTGLLATQQELHRLWIRWPHTMDADLPGTGM